MTPQTYRFVRSLPGFGGLIALALGVFTVGTAAHGQVLADSVAQFSNTQGQNGWRFGYYVGTLSPAGFVQMPQFAAARSQWERTPSAWDAASGGVGFYTAVSATGGHPHAVAGGTTQTNWAVRRWTSNVAGRVVLEGTFRKTSNFFNGSQDGIRGHVFVGSTEVFTVDIPATDTAPHTFSIPACVSVGTTIDIAIDPKANEFSDGAEFNVVVQASAFTIVAQPAPAVACPLGATVLSVAAEASVNNPATLTYQWQIETAPNVWTPLSASPTDLACPNGSGGTPGAAVALQPTAPQTLISIRACSLGNINPTLPTRYMVRAVVSDGCTSTPSTAVSYTVCPADFNCSHLVSVQDVFDFLSAWFSGGIAADINGQGGITVQDIFDYLAAWFGGC